MSRPVAKLVSESRVVCALAAPLPVERVTRALVRQPELEVAAKLVVHDGRGAVLAEVPRSGSTARCESLALRAAERALAWVASAQPPAQEAAGPAVDREDVETVLAGLGWDWDSPSGEAWRVHAGDAALACTLELRATGGGVHVETAQPALRLDGAQALRAAQRYALEVSRRLVLARLSVAPTVEGHGRAVWDAFLPGELARADTLLWTIEAVIHARALTARPLHALGQRNVARAFRRIRAGSGARGPRSTLTPAEKPAFTNGGPA